MDLHSSDQDSTSPLPAGEAKAFGAGPGSSGSAGRAADAFPSIKGYRITRKIDQGGQGSVYEAVQEVTGQNVAIKVLSTKDPAAKQLIAAEINTLAHLHHDNIIRIYDAGEAEGRIYFVMELFRGEPLHEFMRRKRPNLRSTLNLFVQVCHALRFAHERGVVHRDIKPTNILVDAHGGVKLIDFGLVKLVTFPNEALDRARVGTWAYMSPEQTEVNLNPEEINAQTDVYSLGVTMYEALCGDFPYPKSNDREEMFDRIRTWQPATLRRAWNPVFGIPASVKRGRSREVCPIDRRLERIVLLALKKNYDGRYRSVEALLKDLEHYLDEEPLEQPNRIFLDDLLILSYRKFACRHKLTHLLVLTAIASLLAGWLAMFLIYSDTTRINIWFERFMFRTLPLNTYDPKLGTIRIIARKDETNMEQLAKEFGIEGVDDERPYSSRLLHGKLMAQLALSGCKAVVWDMDFLGDKEVEDAAFVAGVEILANQKPPIPVVASGGSWWFGHETPPLISSNIAKKVTFGSPTLGCDKAWTIVVDVAAQRGPSAPLPSLALAAYTAFRRPGVKYHIQLASKEQTLKIEFLNGSPEEVIPLSFIHTFGESEQPGSEANYQVNDRVGILLIPEEITDPDVLEESLIAYEDVIRNKSQEKLKSWFANKVVLVGDVRTTYPDFLHCPGGGPSYRGCLVNAMSAEALIRNRPIQLPTGLQNWVMAMFAALIGSLLGVCLKYELGRRMLGILFVAGIASIGSLIAYQNFRLVVNPLFPVCAALIAAEIASVLQRACVGGPEPNL